VNVRKLAALRAAIFSINIKKRRFSEIIMKIVAFIRSQNIYVPAPNTHSKSKLIILLDIVYVILQLLLEVRNLQAFLLYELLEHHKVNDEQ
ncbi:hypothetical protein ACP6J5_07270, partial [Staphylococcus simulans]